MPAASAARHLAARPRSLEALRGHSVDTNKRLESYPTFAEAATAPRLRLSSDGFNARNAPGGSPSCGRHRRCSFKTQLLLIPLQGPHGGPAQLRGSRGGGEPSMAVCRRCVSWRRSSPSQSGAQATGHIPVSFTISIAGAAAQEDARMVDGFKCAGRWGQGGRRPGARCAASRSTPLQPMAVPAAPNKPTCVLT